ncbi:hypothetical protein D3C87_796140 [compost metagenome]
MNSKKPLTVNFHRLEDFEVLYGYETGFAVPVETGRVLTPLLEEYLGDNLKDYEVWVERHTFHQVGNRAKYEDHYMFRSLALATQVYLRFQGEEIDPK